MQKIVKDPVLKRNLLETEELVGSTRYVVDLGTKKVTAYPADGASYQASEDEIPGKLRNFLKK